MKTHILKCWPDYFAALESRTKRFELRLNDRNYQIDDVLDIREYDPLAQIYSGRKLKFVVSYIFSDHPAFRHDYCILSLSEISA